MQDDDEEARFFHLREEGKVFLSKVFTFGALNTERHRFVRAVLSNTERAVLGEIEGALCLRLTGNQRKTQITALVSQDDAKIKRVTLQTFKSRKDGWYQGYEKDAFTFRSDEFDRLLSFLKTIGFVDLSNEDRFQIEDVSVATGPKIITDAADRLILDKIRKLSGSEREHLFRSLHADLTSDEINLLLGRKQALEEFEAQMEAGA